MFIVINVKGSPRPTLLLSNAEFLPISIDLAPFPPRYFYAYSIRFRLIELPTVEGGMASCMLESRHFIFTKVSEEGHVTKEEVNGIAVIGMHPYLEYAPIESNTDGKRIPVYLRPSHVPCSPLP